MQYLILRFQHGIEDIIPWCEFIEKMRLHLARMGAGEFEGDDMALDGGDCEALFRGPDVEKLFAVLLPHFRTLPLLVKATTRAELIFGEIDSSAQRQVVSLEC